MLDSLVGMDQKPWLERVREEEELLQQLRTQTSEAAKRRATALADGVAELGTVAAVARLLGRTHTAVDSAIKRNTPAATGPATTE